MGLNIIIQHKFGYKSIFAHLNRMYVRFGESVEQGKVIGTIGETGRATGPHLHYEIKIAIKTSILPTTCFFGKCKLQ